MSTKLERIYGIVEDVNTSNRTATVKLRGDDQAAGIRIKYPKYLSQNPSKGDGAVVLRTGNVRGSYEIIAFY